MTRKLNAVLALAALGFASTSFAQCPASAVPPWSGQTITQGAVAIVAGGYDGTACRMTSVLNAGASGFAAGTVRDDTPANEARYRAQFFMNADAVVNQQAFASVQVFSAQSAAAHLNSNSIIRVSMSGGANKVLNIITANEGAAGNITTTAVPLAAGTNRIEMDWTLGAAGSLRVWVNNTTEGTPTATLSNLNNTNWVGVDRVNLGLAAANNLFRTSHAGQAVGFDEFDSRRQTFIGL